MTLRQRVRAVYPNAHLQRFRRRPSVFSSDPFGEDIKIYQIWCYTSTQFYFEIGLEATSASEAWKEALRYIQFQTLERLEKDG